MIDSARPEDLDTITDMWMDVSRQEFVQYLGQDVIEFFIESGELRDEVESNADSTFVYREQENVLGFVVLQDDLIELMVVRPDCQNQNSKQCMSILFPPLLKVTDRLGLNAWNRIKKQQAC